MYINTKMLNSEDGEIQWDDWDWQDEEQRLDDALRTDLRAAMRIGFLAALLYWLLHNTQDNELDIMTIEDAAADWIERYQFDLIRDLTDTTRNQLRDVLGVYLRNPTMTPMQVRELLLQGPGAVSDLLLPGRILSAAERVEMIVTTEVNRAYTQGLLIALRKLGLAQLYPHVQPPLHPRCRCGLLPFMADDGLHFRFITQEDEKVCQQCGPLHGQDVSV